MNKTIYIFAFALISLFQVQSLSSKNTLGVSFGISNAEARGVVVAGRRPVVGPRPVAGAAVVVGGIRVLPRGCVFGGGIYVCGAVRYRPVIQNGVTVYVVI